MKKFVPFDGFEKGCSPQGKSLHDTMQENPKELFQPEAEVPCSAMPCPPYWQPTGEIRCLGNGLVDLEEQDGCGNSRWTRSIDTVVWVDTGETECDTPNNRIRIQQRNQCGDLRLVNTSTLCCIPAWTPVLVGEGSEQVFNCDQSMLRIQEEDGCGNTRLRANGQAVTWIGTGEARCQPGDNYEIEQINQCGTLRWLAVAGGCPCISDWVDFGSQRCTGEFVEQNQVDGCGASRWFNTGVAVLWTNNGEERCSAGGLLQTQQVSQCGTTRWFTTEETCSNSPPANELEAVYDGENLSASFHKFMSCRLDAVTGLIKWGQGDDSGFTDGGEQSEAWVTGPFDREAYEARVTYMADEAEDALAIRTRSGSTLNTWFDLADTSLITHTMTCIQPPPHPSAVEVIWHNVVVRIDIRKKGEPISGGRTFGPFNLKAD